MRFSSLRSSSSCTETASPLHHRIAFHTASYHFRDRRMRLVLQVHYPHQTTPRHFDLLGPFLLRAKRRVAEKRAAEEKEELVLKRQKKSEET